MLGFLGYLMASENLRPQKLIRFICIEKFSRGWMWLVNSYMEDKEIALGESSSMVK